MPTGTAQALKYVLSVLIQGAVQLQISFVNYTHIGIGCMCTVFNTIFVFFQLSDFTLLSLPARSRVSTAWDSSTEILSRTTFWSTRPVTLNWLTSVSARDSDGPITQNTITQTRTVCLRLFIFTSWKEPVHGLIRGFPVDPAGHGLLYAFLTLCPWCPLIWSEDTLTHEALSFTAKKANNSMCVIRAPLSICTCAKFSVLKLFYLKTFKIWLINQKLYFML